MKPSDFIHANVGVQYQKEKETGHTAIYANGYNDKLLKAILDYLDEQWEAKQ